MQILIIKTSSMGDIIHTLPALHDATKAIPNICFDWIIEQQFAEIPSWHSNVRTIIPIKIKNWKKNWFKFTFYKKHYETIKKLKEKKYDAIIDAQGLIKISLLITKFAKGEKHGFSLNSAREPCASFFYDKKHKIKKQQHAIERTRQLFSVSLNYLINNKNHYSINYPFKKNSEKKPYIIIIHSSTCNKKHWPEQYWRFITKKINKKNYYVKLTWSKLSEYQRSTRIMYNPEQTEILPKSTLTQIAEQLINAKAVISIDTGLAHLAAALKIPNLTLYGPSNPQLVGNYGLNQRYIHSKTKKMIDINPEYVWQQLKILINTTNNI